jgi:DNA polymerase I-like protein with 3'-5' exonuclease and polymerase domains
MLCAPEGRTFLYADLAQIEARILRWLAKSPSLEDFRKGIDVYKAEGSKVFGKPYDEIVGDLRNCSKALVLGAGFGMAHIKFQATVKAWTGTTISLPFSKKAIAGFREKNPEITKFWRA